MDAFRRLRSRRKSKGQADSFTSFADAESSYNTSSSSPWQTNTTRSSATVSRPSDAEQKFSHDQVRQPVSPLESPRSPGSSSRIQPLFVGISRPSTDSRPNTSGSFQTAVDRAANSVSQQHRPIHSPSSQVGLRAGRYIDIFAISGQTKRPTTTFNEDVAERNLDTIALTIEEQHYRYSPASKYQEEVAARNVPHMTTSRSPSAQRIIHSSRTEDSRLLPLSPSSALQPRYGRSDGEPLHTRKLQDPVAHFSRQNSTRAKDGSEQLPVIPQERSSDDYEYKDPASRARIQEAELEMEQAKARWLQVRNGNLPSPSPNTDKPLPASPRPQAPQTQSTPLRSGPVTRDSDLSGDISKKAQDNIQRGLYDNDDQEIQEIRKSRQDVVPSNVHKPDRRSANTAVTNSSEESRMRSDISTGRYDRQSYASDQSRRTQTRRPSVTSTNSYRRQIYGNRTIMDLTTEDDNEVTSVASYVQTPVIENARSDAFRKVHPHMVDHHTPPREVAERDPVVPNARWSSALEPVLDLDQLARRSQIISETARAAAAARSSQARSTEMPRAVTPPPPSLAFSPIQTMTGSPPAKAITFSAISTLTSITPRSSQEILATEKSKALTDGGLAYNVVTKNKPTITKTDSSSDYSKTKTIAPVPPVVKISRPDGSGVKSTIEKPLILRTDSGGQKSSSDKSDVAKRNERRREKLIRAEAIREAAKKKIPAGPLDHEPMPGVKTRDFAVTPLEKPTNKRIEALSERKRSQNDLKRSSSTDKKNRTKTIKPPGKVTFDENQITASTVQSDKKLGKRSVKPGSSSTRKSRPKSTFDEEAFQKKHAEANAALLRLQQSLQQSLDEDSSQAETPRGTETPASRAFSPIDRTAHGKSPVAPSPASVAIAMITAATSSPRTTPRPRPTTSGSSSSSRNTIKPTISVATKPEDAAYGFQTTEITAPDMDTLSPLTTLRLQSNKPPPSPGEVSLSSFPIPTPRTMSPESTKSPPAYVKEIGAPVRRGSQASRASTTSQFAIPSTMVPSRLGSLPENRNPPPPGPPNPHQMQSIDSLIPPANPVTSM